MMSPGAARPLQGSFWKAYWITMRPYLLFVSGVSGLAGVSLVDGVPTIPLVILGTVFFLAYGFGQALTDCFQVDTDSLSAPYRPLVRGAIERSDVLLISLVGLLGSAAVLTYYSIAAMVPAVMTVLGLATYTWFKRRWWGGPWYNAWIVSLVVLLGYLSGAGASGSAARFELSLAAVMLAALAGYANFVLAGYYKDIEADRATGYRTLPVVFGRAKSAYVSDLLACVAVGAVLIGLTEASTTGRWAAAPFVIAGIACAAVAQVRLHGVRADDEAHEAIAPVVHAYILLLAGLAVAAHPRWLPWFVVFFAAYVIAMRHRPLAEQI